MKFIIICNLLLFLGCYKLFGNWEVPIHLGFDPFRVVGGFPTLIDSFFENFFEKTPENSKSSLPVDQLLYPVLSSQSRRRLNWTCPILESSDQCITVVSSSNCLRSSQLSYSFWTDSESSEECKADGNIECKTPFQRGNICENVVRKVRKRGNGLIFFELEDIMINTQIIQEYEEEKQNPSSASDRNSTLEDMNYCKNYSIHETVLVGGENETNIFTIFPFGVNSTNLVKSTDCLAPFPSDVFLCNCRNFPLCQVPILYLTPNATFCGSTTISIYHAHGFIYSAIVTSSSNSETQKHTIQFFDFPQTEPLSKFDLQRGRFHCPSETSCILEILYPFGFLNSLEIPYQIGILVFSSILGIVILSKMNKE